MDDDVAPTAQRDDTCRAVACQPFSSLYRAAVTTAVHSLTRGGEVLNIDDTRKLRSEGVKVGCRQALDTFIVIERSMRGTRLT